MNVKDELIDRLIDLAFAEDIGDGDHTTLSTIPADAMGKNMLLIKEDGVLAGVAVDGNKPVGADGKSNCDAIVMGFESTNFSILQLKLTGLEKANKQLYCGAYVVADGVVSYLYEGVVSDEATPLIVNNGILDQTTPETTVEETVAQ